MSARVHKLQALLSRVQERRDQPRPVRAPLAAAAQVAASSPAPAGIGGEEEATRVHRSLPPAAPVAAASTPPVLAPASPQAAPSSAASAGELSFAGVASSAPPAERKPQAGSPLVDAFASVQPQAPASSTDVEEDEKLRPITLPEVDEPPLPSQADRTIAHRAPEASGEVAQSLGQVPAPSVATFEQLIERSLALRPRG